MIIDRHPVRKRLGPNGDDSPACACPISRVKVGGETMKPIRIDSNVIVGKCNDCSASLPDASVACDREALAVFKYVTKTARPLANGCLNDFLRLVRRVIVDDHHLPDDRFGHDLSGNVPKDCEK
jgi:hypothetical protein